MARVFDELARNPDGEVMLKTYRIPFRPEYVLIGKPGQGPMEMVSIAQPTGRDICAFRFHLSPEAIALVMAQDPNVTSSGGYCSLSIHFDAAESGSAMIEVKRGVLKRELESASA